MPLPTFVVVGAQKCGTSMLCATLPQHPQGPHGLTVPGAGRRCRGRASGKGLSLRTNGTAVEPD
jgi:hypothetical protein